MLQRIEPGSPAIAQSSKPEHLDGLHLVRGLCAVAVMVYHYLHVAKIGTFYAAGTYGVYIFFVLSGFTLYHVYGRQEISERSLRAFFLARAFRILPLYIAIVGIQFAFQPWTITNVSEFVLNATLLFGMTNPGLTSGTPGGWTIGIEAVFYLMFPLLLLFRASWTLAAVFVVSLIVNHLYTGMTYALPRMSEAHWTFHIQPATFLCFFVGGMLLAKIGLAMRTVSPAAALATIGLMASMFVIPHLAGVTREALLADWPAKLMIAGSLAVVCLAATLRMGGSARSTAIFLGNISYALYLVHLLVYGQINKYVPDADPLAKIAFAALISVALSKLIFDYYERPIRDWGRRFQRD